MQWEDVVADPTLADLPYKIELNERGQIIMTPTRLSHGAFQFNIGWLLSQTVKEPGKIVTECAIQTPKGTKVADVAWFSSHRWEQVKDAFDAPIAPEICVEVLSPGNSADTVQEKRRLYVAQGAAEVWTCDDGGTLRFYTPEGEVDHSWLVPDFPKKVVL